MRLRSGGGAQREKLAAPAILKIRTNPSDGVGRLRVFSTHRVEYRITTESKTRFLVRTTERTTEERKGVLLAEMDVEMDVNQMYNADGAPVGFDNGQQGGGRGPGGRGR